MGQVFKLHIANIPISVMQLGSLLGLDLLKGGGFPIGSHSNQVSRNICSKSQEQNCCVRKF